MFSSVGIPSAPTIFDHDGLLSEYGAIRWNHGRFGPFLRVGIPSVRA